MGICDQDGAKPYSVFWNQTEYEFKQSMEIDKIQTCDMTISYLCYFFRQKWFNRWVTISKFVRYFVFVTSIRGPDLSRFFAFLELSAMHHIMFWHCMCKNDVIANKVHFSVVYHIYKCVHTLVKHFFISKQHFSEPNCHNSKSYFTLSDGNLLIR